MAMIVNPDNTGLVLAENIACSPALLVSGLVNTTELGPKIEALMSWLSTGLNSDQIQYITHSLTYRDGCQAALVVCR